MKIRCVVLAALAALPAGAQPPAIAAAPAPMTLSLDEALRRALSDNLAVARARAEIAAAEAQRRISLSTVLPRMGVNGAFTRNSEEAAFGNGEDRRIILPGSTGTTG